MSTLGPGARSTRAPAMPSITGRPSTGSTTPGATTARRPYGPSKCAPPSVDCTSCASSRKRARARRYRTRRRCPCCRCAPCSRRPGRCCALSVAGTYLAGGPRVAAVAGVATVSGVGKALPVAVAAERRPADVDVAEEPARRGVVSPDLLLVGERCRGLLRDDHRRRPGRRSSPARGRDVVGARDRDRLESLDRPRSPGRAERSRSGWRSRAASRSTRRIPSAPGPRTERDRRVTVRDQAGLVVAGKGADRTGRRCAPRGPRPAPRAQSV